MTDLEKLRLWLEEYPGWEGVLTVDFVSPQPGSTGVFPAGLEEIGRKTDLLGNLQIDCRYRFTLYRRTAPGCDGAAWLLAFQNWVQQQNAAGRTPGFGDVPELEQIQAQKGALKNCSRPDAGTYAVTLLADFVKQYSV